MKCPKCGSELRKGLSFCPKCGNVINSNGSVQVSGVDSGNNVQKKKTPAWLMVLAILFFPISLTYLLVKTKKIKTSVKIVLIVLLWVFVLVVGNSENDETSTQENENVNSTVQTEEVVSSDASNSVDEKDSAQAENTEVVEEESEYHVIDTFIEKYNAIATLPMTDATEMDIYNKSGGYYRTEYRTLYNAVGKVCNVGEATIEIVSTDEMFTGYNIRVYLTTESVETAEEVFAAIVKIVYPNITDEQLQSGRDDLHRDTSCSLEDIVFYYHSHNGEMFMNNVMYAE